MISPSSCFPLGFSFENKKSNKRIPIIAINLYEYLVIKLNKNSIDYLSNIYINKTMK